MLLLYIGNEKVKDLKSISIKKALYYDTFYSHSKVPILARVKSKWDHFKLKCPSVSKTAQQGNIYLHEHPKHSKYCKQSCLRTEKLKRKIRHKTVNAFHLNNDKSAQAHSSC